MELINFNVTLVLHAFCADVKRTNSINPLFYCQQRGQERKRDKIPFDRHYCVTGILFCLFINSLNFV